MRRRKSFAAGFRSGVISTSNNMRPPSKCEALLSDILSRLSPHVALDESRQLPALTGDAFVETDAIWDEVYPKIQALESFHGFFHDPHLLAADAHSQ